MAVDDPASKLIHGSSLLGALLRPDIVAKCILHVDETSVTTLGDVLHSLEVLVGQVGDLEVADDARRRGAFGENRVAPAETPGENNLGESEAAAVGDGVEGLVGADLFTRGGNLVLRAQRGVGLGDNVVFETELDKVLVGEERVNLNLVDGGLDLGKGQKLLEAGDSPVGDTDCANFAAGDEVLHGSPRRLGVLGEVLVDDILSVRANLGVVVGVLFSSDGPVNEEEVNVISAKVVEGVLQRPLDILGLVKMVPDLCGDEDILTLHTRVAVDKVAHSLTNLILVAVEPGTVEVTVSGLESLSDGLVGLALGTLTGEGAKAEAWHLDAVVESKCGLVGDCHDVWFVCAVCGKWC